MLHDIIDCSKGYDFKSGQQFTLNMKHPSGALAEYRFVPMRHGRTNVPYTCIQYSDDPQEWNNRLPTFDDVVSLVSKSVSGPGMQTQTTSYRYDGAHAYAKDAAPPNYKHVTVTKADGSDAKMVFGLDWELNEGALLSTSDYSPQGTLARKTDNTYLTTGEVASQPFPLAVGSSGVMFSGSFSSWNLPLRSRVIRQDGATFNYTVNAFDKFARPTNVTKASTHTHPSVHPAYAAFSGSSATARNGKIYGAGPTNVGDIAQAMNRLPGISIVVDPNGSLFQFDPAVWLREAAKNPSVPLYTGWTVKELKDP